MLEAAMISAVQRGCRNARLSSSDISAVLLRGVTVMGMVIKQTDPSYFNVRKSIRSLTHVFDKPSDCLRIENIWDLGGVALPITGTAANADGTIDLTVSGHNFLRTGGFDYTFTFTFGEENGDIAVVHDVGGTTEADGTWNVIYVDASTVNLQMSTYTNAWTSGGYIYLDPQDPQKIDRIISSRATLSHKTGWYPRSGKIVVDDKNFTNDIMIDYQKTPSSISDIPSEYHEGLVSFAVMKMIRMPAPNDPMYPDFLDSKQHHEGIYQMVIEQIKMGLKASSEPTHIRNVWCEE